MSLDLVNLASLLTVLYKIFGIPFCVGHLCQGNQWEG